MTRISALAALAAADPTDVLPIVDVSATTTKKITKAGLLASVYDGTDIAAQAITSTKVDFSVANAAARTALTAFEGLEVYQEDVDATYIYDGSAWRRSAQWEELGRTTLGSNGDTISVTPIAARKYLRIFINTMNTGNVAGRMTFNGDSGANYGNRYESGGGAASSIASQISLMYDISISGAGTYYTQAIIDVVNVSSRSKMMVGQSSTESNPSSAAAIGEVMQFVGKWANAANAITRVDVTNGGAGDFITGSELVVLGRD